MLATRTLSVLKDTLAPAPSAITVAKSRRKLRMSDESYSYDDEEEGEEEDDGEEEEEYDEEEQAYLQEQDEQQRRANEDSAHLAGHMMEQEAVATGQTSLTRGQSRVEAVQHLQSSTGASPKQEAPLLAKAKSIVEAHDSPSGGGGRGLSRRASRDA